MIKKNDVLKNKNIDGRDIEVVDIRNEYVFYRIFKDYIVFCRTLSELERDYVIPKEVWELKPGEKYYYPDTSFDMVGKSAWKNTYVDEYRRNTIGVYPTKELAEQALAEIKEKLKK